MKKNIIIRADGGTAIGMGHLIRCLSLSDMLKDEFRICFAVQQPDAYATELIQQTADKLIILPVTSNYEEDLANFSSFVSATDIVVLDGYHFQTFYQQGLKETNCKLVCIDDLNAWHQLADVIINHANTIQAADYSAEIHTSFCLGLNYVLLRKAFLNQSSKKRKDPSALEKIFISMGASDIENSTEKFVHALLPLKTIKEIHLMMGSVNPHIDKIGQLIRSHASTAVFIHMNISASQLHDLLSECDCCICPASSISLEACATGIVLISGYTADNQLKILKGLQHENVLFNWGDFRNLSPASIQSKFGELLLHPEQFGIMLQNQQHLIDGKSPSRLLNVFRSLASKRLHFRYATESDTDLYFKWSNDALVRRNSFNQQTIEYNNHVAWFRAKLKAADFKFYLFFNDANKAVGQVRINRQNGETIIGISVDSEFRGLSYSTEMLTSATDAYFRIYPEATVTAYIKTENTPSLTTFKRAGFINNIQVMQDGYSCYKLNKKRTHDAYN